MFTNKTLKLDNDWICFDWFIFLPIRIDVHPETSRSEVLQGQSSDCFMARGRSSGLEFHQWFRGLGVVVVCLEEILAIWKSSF